MKSKKNIKQNKFQSKIMFCKKCGSLLVPKKTSYGKWMACTKGCTQPELNQDSQTLNIKNKDQAKKIEVDDGSNHLAVHDHKCPKCGFDKAELIEISCGYSDEDNVYRMKCGKCGHVEQLEGKVK
jgi:DNA-directed RNA polymerase subunit M/transcription elongation factor TFIIS